MAILASSMQLKLHIFFKLWYNSRISENLARKQVLILVKEVLILLKKSHKRKSKSRPVAHIYTFAIVWALLAFLTNISADVIGFVILTVVSLFASIVVFMLVREKKDREIEEMLKSDFIRSGDNESKEVVEALRQLEILKDLSGQVKNKKITKKVGEIIQVSKEILNRVTKRPELFPSVRRFFSHHLPTTLKLVEDYIEMENQSTKGDNILASMKKIEDALDMLEDALKKQLDGLFSNSVMDLDVDVDVLKNVLKKDGLIDDHSMSAFSKKENEEE